MEKRTRMWCKALLIIGGLFVFCFLAGRHKPGIDYEKEARIRQYEADESVEKIRMTLLAYGDMIQSTGGSEGTAHEEEDGRAQAVLTTEGIFTYEMREVEASLYKQVTAYVRGGVILEVVEEERQEETVLSNVWVSEAEEERILCFLSGNSFYVPFRTESGNREQVADIVLMDGAVTDCRFQKEKVTGKLLGVTEDAVRLADQSLPLADDVKVYRLYGELKEITLEELPIGYENTDYVLKDEVICACLVVSEENMETIRVLLQSGNYNGRYHESVTLSADCQYTLRYGEEKEIRGAGESVTLSADSGFFRESDRVFVTPSVNSGKMTIESVRRGRERTDYRGSFEIVKTADGLAVINELLLEEYLYGVVPSEMPASYPPESLKAQAVCARTYAYRNMEKAGLPQLGAHVDDSTAFQVYGNTDEKAETTAAVKATKGQILLYGDEAVNAYYYSTSCGYGTDMRAWNGMDAEGVPYLRAKSICAESAETGQGSGAEEALQSAPEELQEEQKFELFLVQEQTGFYESGEPWYRWRYTVDDIDVEEMEKRLADRYALQPQFILTKEEEDYVSTEPGKIGVLLDIDITARNTGGNAAELLLIGSEATYLVKTEYNIRYLLNNGEHPVVRQDGSEVSSPTLLPSAFFVITAGKEDGSVIGYSIAGGGYGHGIGMSQNGAKHMALAGMTEEEILAFFYEGSCLETIG